MRAHEDALGCTALAFCPPRQYVYFGRQVAEGNRDAVAAFDLKKRPYLGPTSMDNELALVMANMALSGKGKLCFDPFVGTGSILVVSRCSFFH